MHNHLPKSIVALIGFLVIAAGLSFAYYLSQYYPDLEYIPPIQHITVPPKT